MNEPHDLQRFIEAQGDGAQQGPYETALAEIRAGAKRSHWMWFIFPQIAGLGHSAMAQRYAITTLGEARAYLAHPLLGPRLIACIEALQAQEGSHAERIFGAIDTLKLRSSLTLFEAAGGPSLITQAIDRWFGGLPDEATLRILQSQR